MSSIPMPVEQVRRFQLAVCEHLGLDPALVSRVNGELYGETATLTITAHISDQEFMDMWNAAATGTKT